MKRVCNLFISQIFLFLFACSSFGQTPVKHFERSAFSEEDSLTLLKNYGRNKELIPQFALQTLIALSFYPELVNTHIRFVYHQAHATLETRPDFPSVAGKGADRTFTITVSDSSMPKIEPILLKNMDFNAQIGIIGHELSHVADFSNQSLLHLMGSGIEHMFSKTYIDRFEFRTDSICIAHGLGYQLLAWSTFIRKTMNTENWRGADNIEHMPMKQERYMNPSTIMKHIENDPLYANTL
jgi:hypothetical protein